jgi:DNA-directed RNA polymerase subunit RPC12/RpoP
MVSKICLHCSKEFYVKLYRKNTANFCSNKCCNVYRAKPKLKIIYYCKICGKEFIQRRNRKRVACSKSCSNRLPKKRNPWNKGKKGSILPNKGSFKKGENLREKNNAWKGDSVGYNALHSWINKYLGKPNKCENKDCMYPRKMVGKNKIMFAPKRFEWANISRTYKRDFSDWIRLCVSCHKQYDSGKLIL